MIDTMTCTESDLTSENAGAIYWNCDVSNPLHWADMDRKCVCRFCLPLSGGDPVEEYRPISQATSDRILLERHAIYVASLPAEWTESRHGFWHRGLNGVMCKVEPVSDENAYVVAGAGWFYWVDTGMATQAGVEYYSTAEEAMRACDAAIGVSK